MRSARIAGRIHNLILEYHHAEGVCDNRRSECDATDGI